MKKLAIKTWDELEDRVPAYALVADVDLVIVRYDESVSVLYGRCAHRGALMSDGSVDGNNLICGVHGWDYRLDSGISQYNNSETLPKFNAWLENGQIFVDEEVGRLGPALGHVDERAVGGLLVGLGALAQVLDLVEDEFEALFGSQHGAISLRYGPGSLVGWGKDFVKLPQMSDWKRTSGRFSPVAKRCRSRHSSMKPSS